MPQYEYPGGKTFLKATYKKNWAMYPSDRDKRRIIAQPGNCFANRYAP